MSSDALTAIYQAHPATRKVFNWIVAADVEDRRTTVEDLVAHCRVPRRHVVNLLRALAEAGYGDFKLGRKGHPSRFEWSEDPQALAEQLDTLAEALEPDDEPTDKPTNGEQILEMFPQVRAKPAASKAPAPVRSAQLIEHVYVLRPGLRVVFELPGDLSAREAEVLGAWVRNLSFER